MSYYTMQFIDYLAITFKQPPALINSTKSVECRPHNGYSVASQDDNGAILMSNPARPDMGYHVVLSGDVLTNYRAAGRDDMDILHWAAGGRISRIDVTVDVIGLDCPWDALMKAWEDRQVITNAKDMNNFNRVGAKGRTLYIGGQKTQSKGRIYDKRAETETQGEPWTRIEIQFRHDKARAVNRLLLATNCEDYRPIINGFIRFIDNPWWDAVMLAQRMPVKIERTEGDTWKWLIRQCAPALAREIALDESKLHLFISHVIDIAKERYNHD